MHPENRMKIWYEYVQPLLLKAIDKKASSEGICIYENLEDGIQKFFQFHKRGNNRNWLRDML